MCPGSPGLSWASGTGSAELGDQELDAIRFPARAVNRSLRPSMVNPCSAAQSTSVRVVDGP